MSFVNLDLHVARLHVHIIKSPLPQKHAPRIELGSDTVSVRVTLIAFRPLSASKVSLCAVNAPVRRIGA